MDIANAKPRSTKPPCRGWAPGDYFAKCGTCGCTFIGDKRATTCADCAYAQEETSTVSENEGFKAPPIKGYTDVPEWKKELVNEAKELEERTLRFIDRLKAHPETDKRLVALAFTETQAAWMWANRSIFQPQRIKLPEDEQ